MNTYHNGVTGRYRRVLNNEREFLFTPTKTGNQTRLKLATVFILAFSLIVLLLPGCHKPETPKLTTEVTFEQLLSDPNKYNGMDIIIEGFLYEGFEVIVLSESLESSGYAQGHLIPKGRMVWVEGEIPKEVYDELYQQQMMGPVERYGKIRTKGKFEYGGKFGHLGQYEYQINPIEMELLIWIPPFARS